MDRSRRRRAIGASHSNDRNWAGDDPATGASSRGVPKECSTGIVSQAPDPVARFTRPVQSGGSGEDQFRGDSWHRLGRVTRRPGSVPAFV